MILSVRVARALLAAAAVTGCSSAITDDRPGALTQFRVHASGADAGGEFCMDFRLTPRQAEEFFGRAKELPPHRLHDAFDILPCWVRGTAQSPLGEAEWEIRAGGTARLKLADGSVQLLGCDTCEALLTNR